MASLPSELSLECKPPQSHSMLMKAVGEQPDHAQKLVEFLSCLEEERLKVDAFKRELPLCMQLLSNAVEASRQQLQAYRANQHHEAKPVLEEFIPLKAASSYETTDTAMPTTMPASNLSDKSNWMTSAQLWSQTGEVNKQKPTKDTDTGFIVNKPIKNVGAFLPFTKEHNSSRSTPSPGGAAATILPELALASSDNVTEDKKYDSGDEGNGGGNINRISSAKVERIPSELLSGGIANHNLNSNSNNHGSSNIDTGGNNQTHRKARRCWSPDLHRRFVSALQMLGGSQVATPKQIRELMKVDGLTNDEVKSHLQKYRLHTRRPSPTPQTGPTVPPQVVVLGGIWVSQEYATAAAAAAAHGTAPGIYGAHPSAHVAPPHYCTPPAVSQEFYAQPPPPPPPTATHHEVIHHHRHQQQLHGLSQAQSSPESGMRGRAGDRSESIEDGKSESSSWKGGDSGGEDNNGCGGSEGKARDDNELECNGSEIALKF
ncbi:hypothetical protein MLD38_006847 [Melastoma candidum]|uniref:Uncharacterized protein n=1 Tax=Melastoma candidum TaxID=119954 RepID=A0ACB9RP81_9MYRT|nr:hypothetical protein MLD38_006847 [Melastoma candidum]